MPIILIPAVLRSYINNQDKIVIQGATLKNVLENLSSTYPAAKNYIFDDNEELNNFIIIYLNNKIMRSKNDLENSVKDEDLIEIVLSIAGG